MTLKLHTIVASTRPGRIGPCIAQWFNDFAAEHGKFDPVLVDLADFNLPIFDEPEHPRLRNYRHAHTRAWSESVAEADAFVFVTPEYNRSTSAVLKNAIDYMDFQMENKPVALVGHGSSGGAQAIANLRMALPGVGVVTVPQALFFTDKVGEAIDEAGMLNEELREEPYGPQSTLKTQMETLVWYAQALKDARK